VTQRTDHLLSLALWVVNTAIDSGISQGVPPEGRQCKTVFTQSFFSDSISAKRLLYWSGKL